MRRFDGHIVAALNVSGPAFRFAARLDAAGGEVAAAAVGCQQSCWKRLQWLR